ncbi:hypothetical protein RQP46_010850 [Phenoliferia psychrophenolica]
MAYPPAAPLTDAEDDIQTEEGTVFLERVARSGIRGGGARRLWESLRLHYLFSALLGLVLLSHIFAPHSFDVNATDYSEALPHAIAQSLSLTHAQCDVSFPKLWPQIEQRPGGARVAIIDGQMFVKKYEPYTHSSTRTQAVLGGLYEAVTASVEPMPDVDMTFHPQDKGGPGTGFSMTRSYLEGAAWLIPDFGFYSWPEPVTTGYKGVWRKIERVESEVTWENKVPKLFWRGAFLAPIRDALRKAADRMPWGDIGGIEWGNKGKGSLPLWDHCRYKYLAHAEGFGGAYSGRLKYLLDCRSVIIAHELHWDQHFHAAFDSNSSSPNQNIIILKGKDWDELGQTMTFLEENPERAELIAANAWRTLHGR